VHQILADSDDHGWILPDAAPRVIPLGLRTLVLGGWVSGCAGAHEAAREPVATTATGAAGEDEAVDHHGSVHHRFERADEWVSLFEAPDRDAWQKPDEIVSLLKVEPGMTIVDLGAGTGYFLRRLSVAAGTTGRVLGLDVEPDMVRYMRERAVREGMGNVEARLVPYDDPALDDGSIDRVLIVDTWHHVAARPAYARRLARSLAPGGAVFVVDYTIESSRGPPRHLRLLPEAVARELREGGLAPEIATESLQEQYVVVGRSRE